MVEKKKDKKAIVIVSILLTLGLFITFRSIYGVIKFAHLYIGNITNSVFTYFFGVIFGVYGWNIHFGVTLIFITIYLLKKPKIATGLIDNAQTGQAHFEAKQYKEDASSSSIDDEIEQINENMSDNRSPGTEYHRHEDLSVLEWFATLILLSVPLVNLIFLFVWAFGSEISRKNFSRATLLYILISSFVAIILTIVILSSEYPLYFILPIP